MPILEQHVKAVNWVLRALRQEERELVLRQAERVSLTREQSLLETGESAAAVYFPVGAVVSLVQSTASGDVNEVATVGRDGMVGLPIFLGDRISPWDAFCQIPGDALRVPAEAVGDVGTASPGVREVLARYCHALLVQIARNSACNQLHSMAQRCSRWILIVRRQCGRDEFPLTQQSLATMLAVRRATVTVTAGELQKAGAISYHHGAMRITDLAALNELACDCYAVIAAAYNRLVPP